MIEIPILLKNYSAIRENEKSAIYKNMDGPWEYYAKWNKLVRKAKDCMISHEGYKTETHRHRQQHGGCQRGEGGDVVKGGKCMVTEDDLTLSGGHTMQCTGYRNVHLKLLWPY